MNTTTKVCLILLVAWVGYCGWLAHNYKGHSEIGNQNALNHVQRPPPPISPEAVQEERAIAAAAAKADTKLKVNGKLIVVTGMLPRHFPQ